MPLHLLSKKSWNVYAPDNIARVKRDEAAAAAREEEEDCRLQEYDAERRLAKLRGEKLPSPPPATVDDGRPGRIIEGKERSGDYQDRRKKRKLVGEDDTDRDIRLAKSAVDDAAERTVPPPRKRKSATSDAPIVDQVGHVNLFPTDERALRRSEKNAEAESEKKRKEREYEDQYTMRFSNAAGKDGLKERPWYASNGATRNSATEEEDANKEMTVDGTEYWESKNVWGRPDPKRPGREKARMSSGDPLAFMNKAQVQLRQVDKDRKKWVEQRIREELELKQLAEKEERRASKRARRQRSEFGRAQGSEDDDFEGFSLNGPAPGTRHRSTSDDERRSGQPSRHESSRRHEHKSRRGRRRGSHSERGYHRSRNKYSRS